MSTTETPADHPAHNPSAAKPLIAPKRLYGALAAAEMVTWALLIIGMVLKYTDVTAALVPVFGLIHGVVFIAYCVVTVFVWVNQRWTTGRGLAGLGSAIIPFLTLPFERAMARRGLLDGGWRLQPGGDAPRNLVERLQAFCLRRPLVAVLIGLLVVAALTTIALIVGPPVGKG